MQEPEPGNAARRRGEQLGEQVDLLVVGGGINGAGIARDAAGPRPVGAAGREGRPGQPHLVASTKLIHGGLRYLEYYEFRLVREALIEREVLLRAAPHIIWPLRFVLPHSPEHAAGLADPARPVPLRPSRRPQDAAGLDARVDLRGDPAGRSRSSPGSSAASTIPTAGSTTPGWWCSTPCDAAERGAEILTRTRCDRARRDGDGWLADLRRRARRRGAAGRARAPWSTPPGPGCRASCGGGAGRARSAKRVRLVKGSHIVVPRLFDRDHAYILQNHDRRIIFAIPYEDDFTLIGTTDVDLRGRPGRGRDHAATRSTICASVVNRYFSASRSPPADVVWTYSGVRPLYDDASGDASAVTRDYVLRPRRRRRRRAAAVGLRRQDHDLPQARRARAGEAAAACMGFDARRLDRRRAAAGRRHRRMPTSTRFLAAACGARIPGCPSGSLRRLARAYGTRLAAIARRAPPAWPTSAAISAAACTRPRSRYLRRARMGAHAPTTCCGAAPSSACMSAADTVAPAARRWLGEPRRRRGRGGARMSLRLDRSPKPVGGEVWI